MYRFKDMELEFGTQLWFHTMSLLVEKQGRGFVKNPTISNLCSYMGMKFGNQSWLHTNKR